MTDVTLRSPLIAPSTVRQRLDARLKGRHAAETRFRLYGVVALSIAAVALVTLLWTVFSGGISAFTSTRVKLEVFFDPAVIFADGKQGPEAIRDADFQRILRESLLAKFPDVTDRRDRRKLEDLISRTAHHDLRAMATANPGLVGQRIPVSLHMDGNFDMVEKGFIDRSLPEDNRPVNDKQLQWLDKLKSDGLVTRTLNTEFLVEGNSRNPERASLGGAIVGSLWTMAITLAICFPIAVSAAIYLEEFAPKNKWTDLIEVNINNLAAVPSIVFGLLGLAVFLGTFGLARSTPVVGGLVLALMNLPIIIIAARAALRSVPPSIRQAALGMGASKMQCVTHHVLPLAMPGILTGTILSMAHALGETAPLIMIGMVAFITAGMGEIGPLDPSAVIPVQIYMWADMPERAFVEKTSAAIIVLLAFLVVMNGLAIVLRKRFERRW